MLCLPPCPPNLRWEAPLNTFPEGRCVERSMAGGMPSPRRSGAAIVAAIRVARHRGACYCARSLLPPRRAELDAGPHNAPGPEPVRRGSTQALPGGKQGRPNKGERAAPHSNAQQPLRPPGLDQRRPCWQKRNASTARSAAALRTARLTRSATRPPRHTQCEAEVQAFKRACSRDGGSGGGVGGGGGVAGAGRPMAPNAP
jgi:hypothetical protein